MTKIKSLNKVLDILEVFLATGGSELRLSEIAQRTGINKATVYHIIADLVERDYLYQVERRGKYALGKKFLNFSAVIRRRIKLRDIAMPFMVKLTEQIDEAVSLFSWDGEKMVFIDETHSRYPLRIVPDPGAIVPLYCTAVGKVSLAYMTEKELENYWNHNEIKAHTPNTIVDFQALKEHLRQVAKEGIAYDIEELFQGVNSMAVPIRDASEQVAGCVSVLGPSFRLTKEKMSRIAPHLKHCAMEISIDMGYRES